MKDGVSDYWIYGVCYTLAMIFSNSSLKHVNYPTQVLGKSCKMIPVLLAGTLFGSRTGEGESRVSAQVLAPKVHQRFYHHGGNRPYSMFLQFSPSVSDDVEEEEDQPRVEQHLRPDSPLPVVVHGRRLRHAAGRRGPPF